MGDTKKLASVHAFIPQAFGAKADGKTDDSRAIREAMDAATTAKGALVFQPGTYLVTSTLAKP